MNYLVVGINRSGGVGGDAVVKPVNVPRTQPLCHRFDHYVADTATRKMHRLAVLLLGAILRSLTKAIKHLD